MNKGSREKTRKIQIMISDSLNNRLSRASDRSGVTKSAFVRVALEREFALDQQLDEQCARADLAPETVGVDKQLQPLLFEV
jgi:hypothetical protein